MGHFEAALGKILALHSLVTILLPMCLTGLRRMYSGSASLTAADPKVSDLLPQGLLCTCAPVGVNGSIGNAGDESCEPPSALLTAGR